MSTKTNAVGSPAPAAALDAARLVAVYKKVRPLLAAAAAFSPQVAAFLAFCDTVFVSPEALEAAHHVARAA
jgi:hypothetical protein